MSGKREKIRLIYWDSCVFFAYIKQETCWSEDVMKGIDQIIEQAYAGQVAIVTSAITIAEVLQSNMKSEDKERYQKTFSHPNLQVMDVDRRISSKAAVIREFYQNATTTMALGDAFHVATAIHYNVAELQTLDGAGKHVKRLDLLKLNGNVAGASLRIVQPKFVPPPAPLTGPLPEPVGPQQSLDLVEVKNEESKTTVTTPAPIQGSGGGSPQDKAGTQAVEGSSPQAEDAAVAQAEMKPPESETPAD
jgi:predicted nucleic acid-binding protein